MMLVEGIPSDRMAVSTGSFLVVTAEDSGNSGSGAIGRGGGLQVGSPGDALFRWSW